MDPITTGASTLLSATIGVDGVLALILGFALVAVLLWVAWEVRSLHNDLQPLIDAPIVQGLSRAGV